MSTNSPYCVQGDVKMWPGNQSVSRERTGAKGEMEADGNASRGDPVAPSGPSTMTSTRIESSESGPHEHASPSLGVSESAAPVQIQDANGRERAEITVHVKFIHHESVALVCAPTITIAELRRRVMEVEHARASGSDEDGSEPPRLRLIYKGKVLKDDQTLDAYNFQHEDTIHAVLGRPQTPSTPASASLAPAPPVQDRPIESISGEVDDTGNGFVMGRFNTGTDVSPVDLGSLLGSVISGTMFGAAGATSAAPGVSMQVSFASGTVPASSAPTSTSYTRVTAATTTSASLPTTSTSTTTSARYAATASSGSSSTTPAAAMSGVSPARAHFLAQTTAAANQRITNASAFQGQAGAVRRMMPPIDLGPMSRPQALSEEMYELGNAVREASDTFMALHRQLAHLSGRLLNENNLSSLERARLRMQIQRLGPVLRGASGMSTSLDQLLSESSLGWPTRSTPATPSNANGPPPGPASSAGAPPARPEPRSDAGAGQASSRPSFWDNLQRGGNHPQPGGSDPVDDNLFMTELASYYEELHQSAIPESGAPQTQANEASSSFSRNSGSASTPPSTVDRRQHGTNVITSRSTDPAGRPPSASDSNRPSLSALNYLQRLSESARSSTSGVGALGSILTETGNLLSQFQSSERPTSAPSSAPLNTVGRANIGVPADSSSASSARMAASLRTGIGLSSPPIISTTPISDLIATVSTL
jgi:hypothetical protein